MFGGANNWPDGEPGANSPQKAENTQPVGQIRTAAGFSRLIRADGAVVHPAIGVALYEGDLIETGADSLIELLLIDGTTFHLYANTQAAVDEFVYGDASPSDTARMRVTKGQFGFVAGDIARAGRLIVDTPLSLIRSRPSPAGAAGSLALLFVLCLINEAEAASEDISIVEDGTLTFKDLEHGVFEIITKGADPQVIVVDDPSTTIILRPRGTTVSIDQSPNSQTHMEDLQAAYRTAFVTFAQGQQDLFTQLQRTASNGTTVGNSTGLPEFLRNASFTVDANPFNPGSLPPGTLPPIGTGGGVTHVNPTTLAATVSALPVSNDQHVEVSLAPSSLS